MNRKIIPGFYVVRLVHGGPPVPAQIIWDGFVYRVEINGRDEGAWTREQAEVAWGDSVMRGDAFTHPLLKLVLFGKMVDEPDYRHRCRLRDWALKHDPEHGAAKPRDRVDLNKQKPVF